MTIIVGGWTWSWWWSVTDVQRLSFEVMTINPVCESIESSEGAPLTVTGVAKVKINEDAGQLQTAMDKFLGKTENEIKTSIVRDLEGHLRAITGTLTAEEVDKDRDQLEALVLEVARPDLARYLGIEILSFTINHVCDPTTYSATLEKAQTSANNCDSEIGATEANRDV